MNKHFAIVLNRKDQVVFKDKNRVNKEHVGVQIETTTDNMKT